MGSCRSSPAQPASWSRHGLYAPWMGANLVDPGLVHVALRQVTSMEVWPAWMNLACHSVRPPRAKKHPANGALREVGNGHVSSV